MHHARFRERNSSRWVEEKPHQKLPEVLASNETHSAVSSQKSMSSTNCLMKCHAILYSLTRCGEHSSTIATVVNKVEWLCEQGGCMSPFN